VLNIQPFHGPALGGMSLTIHGHNLKSSHGYSQPEVFVGGEPCTELTVVDQEELTCLTPPGVGGKCAPAPAPHVATPVCIEGWAETPLMASFHIAAQACSGTPCWGAPMPANPGSFTSPLLAVDRTVTCVRCGAAERSRRTYV
jgi:hypothetical protein